MNNFENSVQAAHDAQLAEMTVLKEKQQDKKKPEHIREPDFCKFCNNNSNDLSGFFLIGNRLCFRRFKVVLADTGITYCPMCGRKLYDRKI